jgi:hypothetical protein
MAECIRSEQRLIMIIVALIFGPLVVGGPAVGGIWLLIVIWPNLWPKVWLLLGPMALCGYSALAAYFIFQNYHWVEFEGLHIRGKRFWTRRLVEHSLTDVHEIRPLKTLLLGWVTGWEICFYQGPSIILNRDMKNAEQLIVAVTWLIHWRNQGGWPSEARVALPPRMEPSHLSRDG